jgi:hypothetical protein
MRMAVLFALLVGAAVLVAMLGGEGPIWPG